MKLFPQGRSLRLQETWMKRFEEALAGWHPSRLSQSEAALLLEVCERTFRRQIARYGANGLEGLLDKRISQASRRLSLARPARCLWPLEHTLQAFQCLVHQRQMAQYL